MYVIEENEGDSAFGEMKMKRVIFLLYLSKSIWTKMPKVLRCIQAYLGDIASLVPDHCNKVNMIIKSHEFLWFPSTYKSYVYIIL